MVLRKDVTGEACVCTSANGIVRDEKESFSQALVLMCYEGNFNDGC